MHYPFPVLRSPQARGAGRAALTLFLACILIVGAAPGARAQAPLSLHLGPKLGPTVNRLPTQSGDLEATSVVGFSGGAFVRLGLKKFLLQPEALVSLKGGEVELGEQQTAPGLAGEYRRTYWTLDFPLMLGYRLLDLKLVKLRLHAGPMTAIKLAESDEYRQAINDANSQEDYKSFIRQQQWGFMAGIGVDVWKITADLRYEGSFGDLSTEAAEAAQGDDSGFRNSMFRLSVGFKLL
jgi:hypothetical protein